ncbi:hypothetical protein L873DRAFT_969456 [Choiromyces venosus 120613-1]|uniref:Extracellular membrane protein CFEM domain-containing protein n=1 Tax=Choiromyces venosus 120613-1 TaxID=1336337 RepID=A0A3N4JQC3_9PEZI|nr:hypothetical protein L873DRAFT_969456 [Choiromyces venosus 120613-1]
MQQWSLARAFTQLAFIANALVVVVVESKGLDEGHYKKAPGCLVNCLGGVGAGEYPRCTPKRYYQGETFNVEDFLRDKKVASCFCKDVDVLGSIGECVYSNCRPKEILDSLKWGAKTCVAAGVPGKDVKDIVKTLEGTIRKQISWNVPERSHIYMGQNVSLTNYHPTPYTKHKHSKQPTEKTTTTTLTQTFTSTVCQMTATSTQTITATWTVTTCGLTATQTSTVTSTATHTVTITPAPTTTISVQMTTTATTQPTSALTTTTTHTASATLAPLPSHLGIDSPTKELNGPSCLADCYNNPSLAGWFSAQQYRGDAHPEVNLRPFLLER